MKLIGGRSSLAFVSIVLLVGVAAIGSADVGNYYFGFNEFDKGEGMWALIRTSGMPIWKVDVDLSTGLLAEFKVVKMARGK